MESKDRKELKDIYLKLGKKNLDISDILIKYTIKDKKFNRTKFIFDAIRLYDKYLSGEIELKNEKQNLNSDINLENLNKLVDSIVEEKLKKLLSTNNLILSESVEEKITTLEDLEDDNFIYDEDED